MSYSIFITFFLTNQNGIYAQKLSDSPRTRCAKSDESPNVSYKSLAPREDATINKKQNYMTPIQRSGCLHQSLKPKDIGT